jgi:hypothetical protein
MTTGSESLAFKEHDEKQIQRKFEEICRVKQAMEAKGDTKSATALDRIQG